MNRVVHFCAVLLALLLGAQGPYAQRLPTHSNIRTIGIISAIGQSFMFERVTPSTLQWLGPPDTSFLDIGDWGVDARVTREAMEVLTKKFAVKPVTFEEADFDTWTWSTLLDRIAQLPLPMDNIDAYVVILRDWRGDEIGGSVHQLAGLGLYRRELRTGVFASYRIAIIDARNDSILASRAVLTRDGKLPWLPVTLVPWPRTQNDLTPRQISTLQTGVRTLIDDTLVPALDEMFAVR